jgi:hypothetical protein
MNNYRGCNVYLEKNSYVVFQKDLQSDGEKGHCIGFSIRMGFLVVLHLSSKRIFP